MIRKVLLRTLAFLGFALLLYAAHRQVFGSGLRGKTYYTLLEDYSFITLACLFVIFVSALTYRVQRPYAAYAYLGASLLKMLAAMLFISRIRGAVSSTLPDFFNFAIAYFCLLAATLWVVGGLIKKSPTT